ncbi:hypothetical protein FACS1894107_07120 [Planctomycetales bacterium]|nr:hypothetical protein FACS1894107_07120 [Planctomycetales bacterium]
MPTVRGRVITGEELRRRDEKLARRICAQLSRGSVSLQLGHYTTAADLDAEWQECLNYVFSQPTKPYVATKR